MGPLLRSRRSRRPISRDDAARVFIALWPPPGIQQQFAACRDAVVDADAAKVPTDRMHLTLHFLGDVDRERFPLLIGTLDAPVEPFELAFGNVRRWDGSLVVMLADETPDPLRALHAALGERLRSLSIPVEPRPFRPHVTLARRAATATDHDAPGRVRWPVRSYVLVEARPGRGGYDPFAQYPRGHDDQPLP